MFSTLSTCPRVRRRPRSWKRFAERCPRIIRVCESTKKSKKKKNVGFEIVPKLARKIRKLTEQQLGRNRESKKTLRDAENPESRRAGQNSDAESARKRTAQETLERRRARSDAAGAVGMNRRQQENSEQRRARSDAVAEATRVRIADENPD